MILVQGPYSQAQDHDHSATKVSIHKADKTCADLPFGITSFGAGVENGWLYVYGGNRGTTHKYSTESQNGQILGINLSQKDAKWQELGTGPLLQGLAMIAHQGNLYCMGGLQATNAADEDQRLISVSTFSKFNVATKQWTKLPSLPEPRSSHDAVVVGDTIYMIGGWNLDDGDETWHETAYSIDLSQSELKWEKLPTPPFSRRALCVGVHNHKIYAVGGMDDSADPTCEVTFYDPKTKMWEDGPELPTKRGLSGFGSSAFAVGGRIYVTTSDGVIFGLDSSNSKWETLHKLENPRFFPRLVAGEHNTLVLVGGTSMKSGKILPVTTLKVGPSSGHSHSHDGTQTRGSKKK